MSKNNFGLLLSEVLKNNYIKIEGNSFSISQKNIDKLKARGFKINPEIIDRLFDETYEEKIFDDFKNYNKLGKAEKIKIEAKEKGKKLLWLTLQIIFLILFMMLIYFLIPSFNNNSSQIRDEDGLYQDYYRK